MNRKDSGISRSIMSWFPKTQSAAWVNRVSTENVLVLKKGILKTTIVHVSQEQDDSPGKAQCKCISHRREVQSLGCPRSDQADSRHNDPCLKLLPISERCIGAHPTVIIETFNKKEGRTGSTPGRSGGWSCVYMVSDHIVEYISISSLQAS